MCTYHSFGNGKGLSQLNQKQHQMATIRVNDQNTRSQLDSRLIRRMRSSTDGGMASLQLCLSQNWPFLFWYSGHMSEYGN